MYHRRIHESRAFCALKKQSRTHTTRSYTDFQATRLPRQLARGFTMEESTVADAIKRGNPVVFFDITIGGEPAGRIMLELFKNLCPKVSRSHAPERNSWSHEPGQRHTEFAQLTG
jgi:hypothetical protein